MTAGLLGERLRKLRARHGLTQEQFAEVAHINYKFYQQVESGRKKQLWLETVDRLAAGFGLAAWQLLAPDFPAHSKVVLPAAEKGPQKKRKALGVVEFLERAEPSLSVAEAPPENDSIRPRKKRTSR